MDRADEIARKITETSSREHGPTVEHIAAALRDFAKEERERCAKIAQEYMGPFDLSCSDMLTGNIIVAHSIAAKIREDGKVKP